MGWSEADLSRKHAEENHRWTQMNTDLEGRTWVSLCLTLGHGPVNGYSQWKRQVLSSPYLCLSVSICGCIELLRLRGSLRTGRRSLGPV
jgi:hypothetical protein